MNLELPPFHAVRPAQGDAPRVSVVVPAYRAAATLLEAVRSALEQTGPALEVIVVDDACPIGSSNVLEGVCDPRLRILQLADNAGVSGARNVGLHAARGEFIMLLDSDDRCVAGRVQKQVSLMEARRGVGLVAGLAHRIDESGRRVATASDDWRVGERALHPLLLFTNPFTTSSLMVRRSAVPPHGFRSMLAEDYAFIADVAQYHPLALIREPVVEYRLSSGGAMATRLDRVAEGALGVQRRALARIGVHESACDASLTRSLMYLGTTPAQILTGPWLKQVRAFLDNVQVANRHAGVHDATGMAEACTRMWEMALCEAMRRGGLRLGFDSARLLLDRFPAHASALRARAVARGALNLVRRTVAGEAAVSRS